MYRLLNSRITALILTLVAAAVCISLYMNSRELKEPTSRLESLRSQVIEENRSLEVLQQHVSASQSGYIKEQVIRDQLLMQKPGEYVIQVPDLPAASGEVVQVAPKKSPWEQWLTVLGVQP